MISIRKHKIILTWATLFSIAGIGLGVYTKGSPVLIAPTATLLSVQRTQTAPLSATLLAVSDRTAPLVPTAPTTIASSQQPTPSSSSTHGGSAPRPIAIATSSAPITAPTPPPQSVTPPSPPGLDSVCSTKNTVYTSDNWGGYVALKQTFTAISGSWVVTSPTPNPAATLSTDASWIGIGGWGSTDLIQVGTANTVQANGNVSSLAWYELIPAAPVTIPNFAVHEGDTIQALITQTTPGHWKISISNQTSSATYSTNVDYTSTNVSAEWIQEDPSCSTGKLAPLDRFGTVNFFGGSATVSGTALSIQASGGQKVILNDTSGQPVATTSNLTANGTSFSLTQK